MLPNIQFNFSDITVGHVWSNTIVLIGYNYNQLNVPYI